MARVNVDSQALVDARFGILSSLMGLDDPDYAMGKMVRLWMQCIERETYVITKPVIVSLFRGNQDAPMWLVQSELAEEVEGGLRIKGTKGRIEYLAEKRAKARRNGTKGGRPAGGKRKPTLVSNNNQRRGVVETPPAPAPALIDSISSNSIADEQVKSSKSGKKKPFSVPSEREVADYCREIGAASLDPQRFIDYYAANGWKVSGVPMRDWKATIRNWHRNEKTRGPHTRGGKPDIVERQGPALLDFIAGGQPSDS